MFDNARNGQSQVRVIVCIAVGSVALTRRYRTIQIGRSGMANRMGICNSPVFTCSSEDGKLVLLPNVYS